MNLAQRDRDRYREKRLGFLELGLCVLHHKITKEASIYIYMYTLKLSIITYILLFLWDSDNEAKWARLNQTKLNHYIFREPTIR